MASVKYSPIALLLLMMNLNGCTSTTFDSAKLSCSKACQNTVDDCKTQAMTTMSVTPTSYSDCQLMTATFNGVNANQCLVKIGFCTEVEFVQLKNAACQGSDSDQQTISQAKTALYATLNTTSDSCRSAALSCTKASSVGTVLKQSEQYCDLFQINNTRNSTKSCLTAGGCTEGEFNSLNSTACTSPVITGGRFATAVVATSPACKYFMEFCTASNPSALALIQGEQYCQVMNINNYGKTTYSCLVGSTQCTQSEFDQMKQAACSGSAVYAGWLTLLVCLIYAVYNN